MFILPVRVPRESFPSWVSEKIYADDNTKGWLLPEMVGVPPVVLILTSIPDPAKVTVPVQKPFTKKVVVTGIIVIPVVTVRSFNPE